MPMTFQIDQGLGTFVPTDEDAANRQLEQLRQAVMAIADDPGAFKKSARTVKNLLSKDLQFLRAYAMLAEMYIDLDEEKEATAIHIKGCQAGLKIIPEDFNGPLDMENADVQCFMRCHAGYVEALVAKNDYQSALEASYRQMVFDPDDIFGRAAELGELAIMAGEAEEAAKILAEQTENRPTAWYSLGYLAFLSGDLPLAVSRLRKAFLLAPYAVSFLTGRLTAPNLFWEQGPRPPVFHDELYFVEMLGGEMWTLNEGARDFMEWLSQTGLVLTEKASLVKLSEKCLAAGGVTDEIETEFQTLWNSINEDSSRELVQPIEDPASGEMAPPWELLAAYHEQLADDDDSEDGCDDDCDCGCRDETDEDGGGDGNSR